MLSELDRVKPIIKFKNCNILCFGNQNDGDLSETNSYEDVSNFSIYYNYKDNTINLKMLYNNTYVIAELLKLDNINDNDIIVKTQSLNL